MTNFVCALLFVFFCYFGFVAFENFVILFFLYAVKPVCIEPRYIELCLISNFSKIPVRMPCIFIYQTASSILWDIPNFPTRGNRVFYAIWRLILQ